jgi:hypothetical protein
MNKVCAVCQHYYWDNSDIFSPPEFYICPSCAKKGFYIKTTTSGDTQVEVREPQWKGEVNEQD